jgi:uncharacterized protein
MDIFYLILSGALVGFAIGLTGVGGGSLMTPILLLFGYPAPVAIGTDLLYAAFTKSSGVFFHNKKSNVRWKTMGLMALGSIPVSIAVNLFVLDDEFRNNENYAALLTTSLGVMLVITSLVIAFQDKIQKRIAEGAETPAHLGFEPPYYGYPQKHTAIMTVILGIVLGFCVTLSSVGAGAFGAAILFILYPRLKAARVVGTDIAHAVPLTLVAGLGYLYNDLVDFKLLGSLLCGSLPGIYLGTMMGSKLPEKLMRMILVVALFSLGAYFSLNSGH